MIDVRFVRTSVAAEDVPELTDWPAAGTAPRAPDGPALSEFGVGDLPQLLSRTDGITWVDIPEWDEEAERVLAETFGFHPLAIRDCRERNQVPKVHVYPGHVFLVLHAPHAGAAGHVHYVELDQFIGPRFLVTTHGPVNPAVPAVAMTVETQSLVHRLESGRLRPTASHELSHGLVSSLTGRLRAFIAALTQEVWTLEQRVTSGHLGDAEAFLEEMFQARHGLLVVETMASLSREVYARMAKIAAFGGGHGQELVEDNVDQFERLRAMAHGQKDYLVGTIEFYQARTNTKMTIAAERLAVIAAVTLPITALSSIYGMNVIVNDETRYGQLAVLFAIMAAMSTTLLIWSKRKGWW